MSRLVVFALVVSLGNASVAFAGETLLGVASRLAREAAPSQGSAGPHAVAATVAQRHWGVATTIAPGPLRSTAALGQEPGSVSSSGIRKRTKVLIYLAAAVGVVGIWYTIDHHVEDSTPSTLGTRRD